MKPLYDNSLPSGWNEKPLGQMVKLRRGYTWTKEDETDRPEEGAVPVIRIPNIQDRLELSDLVYLRNVSEDALEKALVTKGWLLFIGSNGAQDRIGDSVLIEEDRAMVFASFLMGMTVKDQEELIPEFLANWMRMHLVREWFGKTSQQTTGLGNYSWSAVKKLPLRFPADADEQRRIAAVLKLADDAIAKAKAELEATRKVKRSLMQTLFVSGIPDRHSEFVSTKIGRIPSIWQVERIGKVLSEPPVSGTSPQSRPQPPGIPILNVSCVKDGVCNPSLVSYVDVTDEDVERYRATVGDFYVLRGNGNRDYVAAGGLLREKPPENSIYSDKLIRLRFDPEKVAPRFVPYMWQSKAFLMRLQSKAESGSGLWMMSKRDIVREFFACPPVSEQKEIVTLLDGVETHIVALENKCNALQQVKKSLLQNLLTGKIRIPEGAIHG